MKSAASRLLALTCASSLLLQPHALAQEANAAAVPVTVSSQEQPPQAADGFSPTTVATPEQPLTASAPVTATTPEGLEAQVADLALTPTTPSQPTPIRVPEDNPQGQEQPSPAEEQPKKTGWVFEGTWKWFHEDGTPAVGLADIEGNSYYFDADGTMLTGWQWIHDAWYYFEPGNNAVLGSMRHGWLCDGGVWYYLDLTTGAMAHGWQNINGVWYYFFSNGAMASGWQYINGLWYYFIPSGAMQTGWQHINGTWYYLNPAGDMRVGWLCDGGTWYAFGPSGAMLIGRHTVDGLLSCFDSDGACTKTGWQNPVALYQVSTRNVPPVRADKGIFSYITPSRVTLDMTRTQCIDAFVGRALEYIGTPYIWDYACAPGVGVDCAGLVMQCMYAIGMKTPYDPWLHITDPWQDHNANNMYADSKLMWVNEADRQRGDLVFYPGHVAIYLGGDLCIEAWDYRGVLISNVNTKPTGASRIPTGYRRVCV